MISISRQTSDTSMRLVELHQLLALLGNEASQVGVFTEVRRNDLPEDYRKLLAHSNHMTLAVEAFHGCAVDVEVLQSRLDSNDTYFREILLRRERDRAIVQYGIVRLQLNALSKAVRDAILTEKIPLGRVLIEHNVLREVELVDLWRVSVGKHLSNCLGVPADSIVYGRTAMIHFGERPALELLEIVVV